MRTKLCLDSVLYRIHKHGMANTMLPFAKGRGGLCIGQVVRSGTLLWLVL